MSKLVAAQPPQRLFRQLLRVSVGKRVHVDVVRARDRRALASERLNLGTLRRADLAPLCVRLGGFAGEHQVNLLLPGRVGVVLAFGRIGRIRPHQTEPQQVPRQPPIVVRKEAPRLIFLPLIRSLGQSLNHAGRSPVISTAFGKCSGSVRGQMAPGMTSSTNWFMSVRTSRAFAG